MDAFAQKHDYIWLTGYSINDSLAGFGGSRLDFNYSPRSISFFKLPYKFDFDVPCVMSDTAGRLLFYSNGCRIINAQHQTMDNGSDLSPGPQHDYWCKTSLSNSYSRTQGILALPYPDHANQYVLFHSARSNGGPYYTVTYHYSIIDMSLNGGLGKVIQKNQHLLGPDSLGRLVTAVRHGNGRDWWVVLSRHQANVFYLYLLNPQGVQGPFVRDHRDTWIKGHAWGNLNIFSPDGRRFHRLTLGRPAATLLFDFDRCTGEFSHPQRLDLGIALDSAINYGWSAFSPNSRFLYLTTDGARSLYQYDLQAADVSASVQRVGVFDGYQQNGFYTSFNALSNAPDGKIYVSTGDGTQYMHIIHAPDSSGVKCDFRQRDLKVPTYVAFFIPVFPHFRLYDVPGSACDTLGINAPSAVREAVSAGTLHLVPNPTSGELRLRVPEGGALLHQVWLYDLQGRLLQTLRPAAGVPEVDLDLSALPCGAYVLRAHTDGGAYVGRVMKVE